MEKKHPTEIIRQALEARGLAGLSYRELHKLLGIRGFSRDTLWRMLSVGDIVRGEFYLELADRLGIDPHELLSAAVYWRMREREERATKEEKTAKKTLLESRPLIVGEALAGTENSLVFSEYDSPEALDPIALSDEEVYAVKIVGDSMEPILKNGAIVIVSKYRPIRNRDYIIVRLKSGHTYVKRVVLNRKQLILESLNPAYPPILVKRSEVDWMHKIVAIRLP